MPKTIPLNKIRQWLQEYEDGKSEAAIAKKAGSDIRTVKKGIERARRERDAHTAREALLKDSLRQHYDAILGLVQEVLSTVDAPLSTGLAVSTKGHHEAITLSIGTVMARIPVGKQAMPDHEAMQLSFEAKPEWELVEEHLKRDTFHKGYKVWKRELGWYMVSKFTLERKVMEQLVAKDPYQLVNKPVSEPFIYTTTAVPFIFQSAVDLALGTVQAPDLQKRLSTDASTGEVILEGGHILGRAPGREEQLLSDIIAVTDKLLASGELQQMVAAYGNVEKTALKVKQAAQDLLMLGLVPGQCRICKRLGM